MSEIFTVLLDLSRVKGDDEKKLYIALADTKKMKVINDFKVMVKFIFSLKIPIELYHENAVLHDLDDIRILSLLDVVQVRPVAKVQSANCNKEVLPTEMSKSSQTCQDVNPEDMQCNAYQNYCCCESDKTVCGAESLQADESQKTQKNTEQDPDHYSENPCYASLQGNGETGKVVGNAGENACSRECCTEGYKTFRLENNGQMAENLKLGTLIQQKYYGWCAKSAEHACVNYFCKKGAGARKSNLNFPESHDCLNEDENSSDAEAAAGAGAAAAAACADDDDADADADADDDYYDDDDYDDDADAEADCDADDDADADAESNEDNYNDLNEGDAGFQEDVCENCSLASFNIKSHEIYKGGPLTEADYREALKLPTCYSAFEYVPCAIQKPICIAASIGCKESICEESTVTVDEAIKILKKAAKSRSKTLSNKPPRNVKGKKKNKKKKKAPNAKAGRNSNPASSENSNPGSGENSNSENNSEKYVVLKNPALVSKDERLENLQHNANVIAASSMSQCDKIKKKKKPALGEKTKTEKKPSDEVDPENWETLNSRTEVTGNTVKVELKFGPADSKPESDLAENKKKLKCKDKEKGKGKGKDKDKDKGKSKTGKDKKSDKKKLKSLQKVDNARAQTPDKPSEVEANAGESDSLVQQNLMENQKKSDITDKFDGGCMLKGCRRHEMTHAELTDNVRKVEQEIKELDSLIQEKYSEKKNKPKIKRKVLIRDESEDNAPFKGCDFADECQMAENACGVEEKVGESESRVQRSHVEKKKKASGKSEGNTALKGCKKHDKSHAEGNDNAGKTEPRHGASKCLRQRNVGNRKSEINNRGGRGNKTRINSSSKGCEKIDNGHGDEIVGEEKIDSGTNLSNPVCQRDNVGNKKKSVGGLTECNTSNAACAKQNASTQVSDEIRQEKNANNDGEIAESQGSDSGGGHPSNGAAGQVVELQHRSTHYPNVTESTEKGDVEYASDKPNASKADDRAPPAYPGEKRVQTLRDVIESLKNKHTELNSSRCSLCSLCSPNQAAAHQRRTNGGGIAEQGKDDNGHARCTSRGHSSFDHHDSLFEKVNELRAVLSSDGFRSEETRALLRAEDKERHIKHGIISHRERDLNIPRSCSLVKDDDDIFPYRSVESRKAKESKDVHSGDGNPVGGSAAGTVTRRLNPSDADPAAGSRALEQRNEDGAGTGRSIMRCIRNIFVKYQIFSILLKASLIAVVILIMYLDFLKLG